MLLDPLYAAANVLGSRLVRLPLRDPPATIAEQTFLVSGANTGLGFETCLHLSRMGLGTLIMAVRSPDRGEAAKQKILQATGRPADSIDVWPLDLTSYASIRTLARRAAQLPRLDAVLANAGLMTSTFRRGAGGFEDNIQVNVVSTFLLGLLLLPILRTSTAQTGIVGHLVTVNSTLHYVAPYRELEALPASTNIFDGLNNPDTARMPDRYALSKALVLYVVRELAARDDQRARPAVIINTANPSFCKSGLLREDDSFAARMSLAVMARETEAGSRTLVDGLFAGPESHGQFLNSCHVGRPAGHITGTWGRQMQKQVFADLLATLERIEPGISNHV